jgi:hypothetical protein
LLFVVVEGGEDFIQGSENVREDFEEEVNHCLPVEERMKVTMAAPV